MLLDVTVNTDKVVSDADNVKKKAWWWDEHFSTLLAKSDFYCNQISFTIFCSTDLRGKKDKTDHVNKNIKSIYFQDKDTIPWVASCWYLTLYPEANYAMYHILCAFEGAGCTLPSLNTDFRTGQCRYFFQVGMNLPIEQRQSMPHVLVERCNTQKSLCSCSSPLHTVIYLNLWYMQK